MTGNFLDHYVNIRTAAGRDDLTGQLRDAGLATFSGVPGRPALLELAHALLTVYPHRDAGPDGITVITSGGDRYQPGYAGFSSSELLPHTERSGVAEPPQLLVLACATPSPRGGASYLVDGSRLYEELAAHDLETLRLLSEPRSAYFGGAAGYLGAIFEAAPAGRTMVRLRLDELAQFAPQVSRALPRFLALISQHTQELRLRRGEGFILDNTRWLHGRSRINGPRVMLRVLGSPRPGHGIRRGFPTPAVLSVDRHVPA